MQQPLSALLGHQKLALCRQLAVNLRLLPVMTWTPWLLVHLLIQPIVTNWACKAVVRTEMSVPSCICWRLWTRRKWRHSLAAGLPCSLVRFIRLSTH